jgi:tetratricopeptide (TPR) repeat protein
MIETGWPCMGWRWWLLAAVGLTVPLDAPEGPELRAFVASREARMLDRSLPPETNLEAVRAAVAALDRAARQATEPSRRAEGWEQAAGVLGRYVRAWPDRDEAIPSRLQAARFRSDAARVRLDAWLLEPARADLRDAARVALDVAVRRFRLIEASDPAAVSFDLARALAQRAELERESSDERDKFEGEALGKLRDGPLSPEARLLKAELEGRQGRAGEGLATLDAIQATDKREHASTPAPAPAGLAVVRADLLSRDGRTDEALAVLREAAEISDASRTVRSARVLARALASADGAEARHRWSERWLEQARGASGRTARTVRLDLARSLADPPADLDDELAVFLAEGRDAAGDREGAARAWEFAARHASSAPVATQRDIQAALSWLEAGKAPSALKLLGRVRQDQRAPDQDRVRAGWLEALALDDEGRRDEAIAVLEWVSGQEEERPEVAPAQRKLGQLLADRGDRDEAERVWNQIALEHKPERASACLEAFTRRLDASERIQALMSENKGADMPNLESYLNIISVQCIDPGARSRLELARIRYQMSPHVNQWDMAKGMIEFMVPRPLSGEDRSLLDGYAMALAGSTGRLEDALGRLRGWLPEAGPGVRLEVARLLERRAGSSRSELDRRRLGDLLGRTVGDATVYETVEDRLEARVMGARAWELRGDRERAAAALDALPPGRMAPRAERVRAGVELDLGRTAAGLERLDRLSGTYREGSDGWWLARLELAAACLGSGHGEKAAAVLDAAAVLYPDRDDPELSKALGLLQERARKTKPRR